jgi:hypothetical protein
MGDVDDLLAALQTLDAWLASRADGLKRQGIQDLEKDGRLAQVRV